MLSFNSRYEILIQIVCLEGKQKCSTTNDILFRLAKILRKVFERRCTFLTSITVDSRTRVADIFPDVTLKLVMCNGDIFGAEFCVALN